MKDTNGQINSGYRFTLLDLLTTVVIVTSLVSCFVFTVTLTSSAVRFFPFLELDAETSIGSSLTEAPMTSVSTLIFGEGSVRSANARKSAVNKTLRWLAKYLFTMSGHRRDLLNVPNLLLYPKVGGSGHQQPSMLLALEISIFLYRICNREWQFAILINISSILRKEDP